MPDKQYREVIITSVFSEAKQVEDSIVTEAENLGYDDEALFALRLSLEEALTNAIRHGNNRDVKKKIQIKYCVDNEAIEVRVTDEGGGFRPEDVPDPTAEENIARPSGRGIMLMKAYMDKVLYNRDGNEVYMVRQKQG